jgi:hypothetical protein
MTSFKVLFQAIFIFVMIAPAQAVVGDIEIPGYNYAVTDIKAKGLSAQALFNSLSRNWMDLEHSVCANRSHLWSYDLHRKYGINTGTIFVFFGKKVWKGQRHKYWYHAGTYVVEDGQELVLEGSYPKEITTPLTVVEWMDQEMEGAHGKVDGSRCVEIKKDQDRDLTERFYYHAFLPSERPRGKESYHCYFRKVPGYLPYPETVAEQELGVDEDGNKVDDLITGYDRSTLLSACVDAYAGRNFLKKADARSFCNQRY